MIPLYCLFAGTSVLASFVLPKTAYCDVTATPALVTYNRGTDLKSQEMTATPTTTLLVQTNSEQAEDTTMHVLLKYINSFVKNRKELACREINIIAPSSL